MVASFLKMSLQNSNREEDFGSKLELLFLLVSKIETLSKLISVITLYQNWQNFRDVNDVHEVLEITVYDDNKDHKYSFLGKVLS